MLSRLHLFGNLGHCRTSFPLWFGTSKGGWNLTAAVCSGKEPEARDQRNLSRGWQFPASFFPFPLRINMEPRKHGC